MEKRDKIGMLNFKRENLANLYSLFKGGLQIQREVKIMNKYESIIIVNPNLDEASLKELENKFTGLINENGKVESVEQMGKRKLAYEINKQSEGYYTLFNFESKPEAIVELERVYRITDSVMKFIVVKKED